MVVFHDETTERITGAPGTIEARTLAEVKALDAAFGFTQDGGAVPSRGEGIAIRPRRGARALPGDAVHRRREVAVAALAEALAAAVRLAGAERRVCVGSFFDARAERLGALLPGCARYLPQEAATCHVLAALAGGDASACPGGYELASLPVRVTTSCRSFHRPSSPTSARGHARARLDRRRRGEMRALLAMGVDALVTDRPDLLRAVLGQQRPSRLVCRRAASRRLDVRSGQIRVLLDELVERAQE